MNQKRILVAEDDTSIANMLKDLLQGEGYAVDIAGNGKEALDFFKRDPYPVVITDIEMPIMDGNELVYHLNQYDFPPIIFIETVHREVEMIIDVMRKGVHDYLTKPIDLDELLIKVYKAFEFYELKRTNREVVKQKNQLADDNRYLHGELRRLSGDEVIGANFGLKDVMLKVQQVAAVDSPVLLLGDTGVGKDVLANTIHYSSPRSKGPFVSVNCGAIPESLLDSELFGHEKGAFTGALAQKRGRFERAEKGSIFLDEIGELPPPAQVRLLRVLQEKEIERVGGNKTIKLDIRIIAATNRNLEEMIQTGQFREDLWFRINVFPILVPPLRERKADIPALLKHFVILKAKELKICDVPEIPPEEIDVLMQYHWPGNVRELQNIIERAIILNPQGPLTFDDLNLSQKQKSKDIKEKNDMPDDLDEVVSYHIRNVLSRTNGKVHGSGGAAELLGINPNTLRARMKKLGISIK